MLEFEDFLPAEIYRQLKHYALHCRFESIVNPIDGITYPDINKDIPEPVSYSVLAQIKEKLGITPQNPIMFLRMSKQGQHCPNIHHHDLSHGTFSLMLYLNTSEGAGTSLVRHIPSGCCYAPFNKEISEYIQTETNLISNWMPYHKADAAENKAVVFDAGLMHRAEPVGGFGRIQPEARIVLTCFFS